MLTWIRERRKLVVFATGLALTLANEAGATEIVDVDSAVQTIITSVIAVLTLFAAERVPNQPIDNIGDEE
ncbi:MAG: hypothetical protein AAF441_21340 [Pseudomonadota bacterium]